VRVSGLGLHVRESGEGRPLLLINGIGAHMEMWADLGRVFPGTRLIEFDAPGAGRSVTPCRPLSLEALGRLTERLLDRLGYDRVDVLGYSFGGLIAQILARRAPARVRRLVLAATTCGWGGVPGSTRTLAEMSTPLRYYWRPHYEEVIGDLMGGRARHDRQFIEEHGDARQLAPPPPVGYLWQLLGLTCFPGTLPWLHRLQAPTLVVTGDDDPIMPLGNACLLGRYIPQARLLIAPGEGHLLLMDETSDILPAIHDFLRADDLADCAAWRAGLIIDDAALRAALRRDRADMLVNPGAAASALVRTFWTRAIPRPRPAPPIP